MANPYGHDRWYNLMTVRRSKEEEEEDQEVMKAMEVVDRRDGDGGGGSGRVGDAVWREGGGLSSGLARLVLTSIQSNQITSSLSVKSVVFCHQKSKT